jgi:hypothetical protein
VVGPDVVEVGPAVVDVVGLAVVDLVGLAVVDVVVGPFVVGPPVVDVVGPDVVVVPGVTHAPSEQISPLSQQTVSQKGPWSSGAAGPHSAQGPAPKNASTMQRFARTVFGNACWQKLTHGRKIH